MSTAAVVDRHRAARAAIMALGYPGRRFASPARDQGGAVATLLSAVWEPGARLWRDSTRISPPWRVRWAAPQDAEVLLFAGRWPAALTHARRGTEAEPELGATVIWLAGADESAAVLRGPGVDGQLPAILPLPLAALDARAEACADPPLGIELLIVDLEGGITGLPRTTQVQVVS